VVGKAAARLSPRSSDAPLGVGTLRFAHPTALSSALAPNPRPFPGQNVSQTDAADAGDFGKVQIYEEQPLQVETGCRWVFLSPFSRVFLC